MVAKNKGLKLILQARDEMKIKNVFGKFPNVKKHFENIQKKK